jgi:hypothetical protein
MPVEPAQLPEPRRNELLRAVDWRFLLSLREAPRLVDLAPGRDSEALQLIAAEEPGDGEADLAMLGFPSSAGLRSAREALAPGGEVVCRWSRPRPGGPRRARRRLEAAGFTAARVYWAGPLPRRLPQFWLPLDSPAAATHLLAMRPARRLAQRALRAAWRLAVAAGLLAPLYAIARAPGAEETAAPAALLLLTGGRRSINKVVGLEIAAGEERPALALKFARVPAAEAGLGREADVLGLLGEERPQLAGVPRLRGRDRRAGRLAIAESLVEGAPALDSLSADSFAAIAARVTELLIQLAGGGEAAAESQWRERLVETPLARFEREFGSALAPGVLAQARTLLGRLGDMPLACEHRDCSPWNVVLAEGGEPALLDWESAEPRGLPGLDLTYFLANCGFILEGALESGRTRESYARLLDPRTPQGRVAADAIAAYSAAISLDEDGFRRLRALCWIVHSHSDYLHLEMEVAGAPSPEALRRGMFLGLLEEELNAARP